MNHYRLRAYILFFIVAVIWGIAGPIIKYTLQGFSAFNFLFYRFIISAVIALGILLKIRKHFPRDKKTVAEIIIYSLFTTTISLGFLFLGLEKTSVLEMSLLYITGPLFTMLAGAIFLKEHITKREKIGIVITLLGAIFTIIEPIVKGQDNSLHFTGNILILISLVAASASAVYAKRLLRKEVNPLFLTNVAFIVGFIPLIPFAFINRSPAILINQIVTTETRYHLGVFYMAIVSGTIAYYLSNKAQKTIEVSEASLFSYLYPIFATPLAVLFLNEKVTIPYLIGLVIILSGVFIAEVKLKFIK